MEIISRLKSPKKPEIAKKENTLRSDIKPRT